MEHELCSLGLICLIPSLPLTLGLQGFSLGLNPSALQNTGIIGIYANVLLCSRGRMAYKNPANPNSSTGDPKEISHLKQVTQRQQAGSKQDFGKMDGHFRGFMDEI